MTERDVPWLQAGNYTATEDRSILAALSGARHFVDLVPSTSPLVSAGGGHGVVGAADMTVTAAAGMTVSVSLGQALVRGTQQGDQGVYVTSNDAAKSLTISAADATNPRKDLIVTRVKDAEFGIAGDTGPLEVVTGTPTGGLTAGNATGRPTPPENALILAEVFVPAAAVSSASFTITDLRTRASALNAPFICQNSAFYPNPATLGMEVIDLTLGVKLKFDGTNWVEIGGSVRVAAGSSTAMGVAFGLVTGATLTLPPGKWLVQAKGTEVQTGTSAQYDARIRNTTDGADLDALSVFVSGAQRIPWSLIGTLSNTVSKTVRIEHMVGSLNATQTTDNVKIWARPVGSII